MTTLEAKTDWSSEIRHVKQRLGQWEAYYKNNKGAERPEFRGYPCPIQEEVADKIAGDSYWMTRRCREKIYTTHADGSTSFIRRSFGTFEMLVDDETIIKELKRVSEMRKEGEMERQRWKADHPLECQYYN